MRSALPDVPAPELSAIVRAVRARPWRDRHLRSAAVAFAAILLIFLHGATVAAWNFPQASSGAQEENQMRSLRQIAVVSSLAVSSSALAQNAVQWRIESGGNGHWYLPTDSVFPHFRDAQAFAANLGGYLACLTSSGENDFVASLASGDFILGGYQDRLAPDYVEPSGGWRWVSGESWAFTSWQSGEPNNGSWPDERGEHYLFWWRFGEQPSFGNRWNDGWNDMTVPPWNVPWNLRAIIEWSADCNSDGIVDYGQIRSGELADTNSNNIPDCCESTQGCNPCPADVDGSGAVNGVDLAAILNVWGTSGGKYPGADVNHDGIVNGADLSEVLNGWGPCP